MTESKEQICTLMEAALKATAEHRDLKCISHLTITDRECGDIDEVTHIYFPEWHVCFSDYCMTGAEMAAEIMRIAGERRRR